MNGRRHGDLDTGPEKPRHADDTLVVWMGEFGRTPGNGSGHFCNAWSTVWAGGGINTGQVIGRTSDSAKNPGSSVEDRPINAPDFIATLCLALGIDTHQEFIGPGNRPMPLVDKSPYQSRSC